MRMLPILLLFLALLPFFSKFVTGGSSFSWEVFLTFIIDWVLLIVFAIQISYPQLFTPNLKTIQNPCLSLDPGWFLFSPNGCFLLDKKEFPLYGISVEKNTKRKETHMNSLPNHQFPKK
ncbi:IS1380-Spn1 transposase [Streptococcus pneumoniae]|nr:IS1380-Spn1 transposase [Streptococcus pneumoniae]